jgi:hypothetical protein
MFFLTPILFSLAITTVHAIRKCGVSEPSAAQINLTRKFQAEQKENPFLAQRLIEEAISVPTYFHILRSGNAANEGNIPDEWVYDQVRLKHSGIVIITLSQ